MVEMKYDTKKAPLGRTSDSILHFLFIFPSSIHRIFSHLHDLKLADSVNEERRSGVRGSVRGGEAVLKVER